MMIGTDGANLLPPRRRQEHSREYTVMYRVEERPDMGLRLLGFAIIWLSAGTTAWLSYSLAARLLRLWHGSDT